MQPKKLTKSIVDDAKPISGARYFVWDRDLKGFGLLVFRPASRVTSISIAPGTGKAVAPQLASTAHSPPMRPASSQTECAAT